MKSTPILWGATFLLGCSVGQGKLPPDNNHNPPHRSPSPRSNPSPIIDSSTSETLLVDTSPRDTAKSDTSIDLVTIAETQPDNFKPDLQPDLLPDTTPNLGLDLSLDTAPDNLPDTTSDLPVDVTPDLGRDTFTPDLSKDLYVPDTLPKATLGTSCNNDSQCTSRFCTNNVCCSFAKCIDTCVPSGGSACPVYNGWTCAPYGTCRAY